MTQGQPIRVLLHLSAGGLVALAAILGDYVLGNPFYWWRVQTLALAAGLLIIAMGFVRSTALVARASTNICLSLLTLFVLLALGEGFFRTIGFDFSREEQAWRRVPL